MGHFERLDRVALLHEIGSLIHRCEGTVALGDDIRTTLKNVLASVDVTDNELSYIMATSEEERGQLASVEKNTLAPIQLARKILGVGGKKKKEVVDKPLHSIFTVFGGVTTKPALVYENGEKTDFFQFPTDKSVKLDLEKQSRFWQVFLKQLNTSDENTFELVDSAFDEIARFLPGDIAQEAISDVSVYTQSKLVAAIAVCLAAYTEETDTDITALNETSDASKPFLVVSGDFSGIQSFIYTIPSKGALKSLRGRSFYLEIFMEYAVDTLLKNIGLTRNHVLYTGGGHFYLIVPNTEACRTAVGDFEKLVNIWLLEHMGSALYLAIGSAPCSISELSSSKKQRNIFATVGDAVRVAKMQRYAEGELEALFDENSELNCNREGSRECSVCRTSTATLAPYGDDGAKEACPICNGLFNLGEYLVRSEASCFVVASSSAVTNRVGVPILGDNRSLYVIADSDLPEFVKKNAVDMVYGKNHSIKIPIYGRAVPLADYAARYETGNVLDFVELANRSGEDGQGISRVGVLRADVDNLGAAFIGGFVNDNPKEALKYVSLLRQAELSQSLSRFFKIAVNDMAYGETSNLPEKVGSIASLWSEKPISEYNVHVIYSGGDDVFMVGAWNELLEFAVRLRTAFTYYTGGKVTLSAGLALFTPKYPIDKMADITGALESAAKSNPSKDSIALFGFESKNQGAEVKCSHVYTWDDFITGVCGEKMALIKKVTTSSTDAFYIGKTMLYKIMETVTDIEDTTVDGRINIARLLYTLARLQPTDKNLEIKQQKMKEYDEFVQAVHKWIVSKSDRKQLLAALHLAIYYLRDKESVM